MTSPRTPAPPSSDRAALIAARVDGFIREVVIPAERDPRIGRHGPSDAWIADMRRKAEAAGVLTPHILGDGSHLTQRETAPILRAAGFSPFGPIAVNVAAPDEGNMYLLGRIGTPEQKKRFLEPLLAGRVRSAFFMSEPAADGGAGSDPSMLQTSAVEEGDHWTLSGRKAFITGAVGARVGIIMARSDPARKSAATMFLVDLPDPAIKIERVLNTIDETMAGGHAVVSIEALRVHKSQVLGAAHQGFALAQVRLSPARLSHCMRWLGAATRAHEIAVSYACKRRAFGRPLIDHEGVGFMLADNVMELKQAELMIDWCAGALDDGETGTLQSSMTKAAVSELLYRVADRSVQVMGGTGVSDDTIVQRVFREMRAFRIYDGPTEVHRWSIAKKIKKEMTVQHAGAAP